MRNSLLMLVYIGVWVLAVSQGSWEPAVYLAAGTVIGTYGQKWIGDADEQG